MQLNSEETYSEAVEKHREALFFYHNAAGLLSCPACDSRNMSGCDGQYDCDDCGGQMDLEKPEPPTKPNHYTWHVDCGHEWLEVTKAELERLNGVKYYSRFSYQKDGSVFLEGDCDAEKFLQAKNFCGEKVSFTEKVYQGDAPLRTFERLH